MKRTRKRKSDNPFSIHFGQPTKQFIGRSQTLDTFLNDLYDANGQSRNSIITGLRGVGKTTFLNHVQDELANDPEWIVVSVHSTHNLLENITDRLHDEIERKTKESNVKLTSAEINILTALTLSFSEPEDNKEYGFQTSLIRDMRQLNKLDMTVAFLIDEVENTPEMREFAATYSLLVR
ncbi:MAG: AAA family ATPase, partial [Streptococcaceae bacterium]|nr:AAA family ATPase [Streptococcaceae bacterium]